MNNTAAFQALTAGSKLICIDIGVGTYLRGWLSHPTFNKKLSYAQRKCASKVAILYRADGISI